MGSAQGRAGGSLFSRLKSGLNFSFGGSKACIGLSIGATSVKIAELSRKKNAWTLERFALVSLAEGTSQNRDLINAPAISNAIKAACQQAGISSKEVCSALVGSGLIIKNLTLVVTDEKELQDQVFWEAEQYIPFDINDVVLDYQVVKKRGTDYEVLLVAVKKAFLDQYMNVVQDANLKPKIMDTEVFALQNVFEANYNFSASEAMLLADIGAVSTKIVICSGGIPLFIKDASFGGEQITREIQRELKVTLADAEALKVSENLPREVSDIIARMNQVLAAEIKKSLDFYSASSLGPPVAGVLLTGGGSRAVSATAVVEEVTSVPTQLLNPFLKIQGNPKVITQDYLGSISPEVTVPMGLAIRAGEPA